MKALAQNLTRALRVPTVRRIALVILVLLAYQAWLSIQATGKVAAEVGSGADARGRFAIDVDLRFRPERYHILELQKHGRIAGTDDDVVHLRSVSQAGVNAIARLYWTERITASSP